LIDPLSDLVEMKTPGHRHPAISARRRLLKTEPFQPRVSVINAV
jgi:hypothetical protein